MNAVRIVLNIGSLILVAVLGWLLVRIGLGVFQPKSLYAPDPVVAPTTNAVSATQMAAYDFSSDPFSFGEIMIDPLDFIEDAPETTLDLKLIGIVSESSATFQMSDRKNKPVKIDEEVMNGVTLKRTAKDFVMLDVNGESQKLTLERIKLGEKSDAQIITRAAPTLTASTANLATAEAFLSKVQLRPHMEMQADKTTKMVGLKITARPGADLAQFDLKSGDVLTRVGPVLLNTKTPNIKELSTLLQSGAAQDFEVIRNGAPVTIRIGQ